MLVHWQHVQQWSPINMYLLVWSDVEDPFLLDPVVVTVGTEENKL